MQLPRLVPYDVSVLHQRRTKVFDNHLQNSVLPSRPVAIKYITFCVKYSDRSIITTTGEKVWKIRMESDRQDSTFCEHCLLRNRGIFKRVNADHSSCLFKRLIASITHSEHITVLRVWTQSSHLFAIGIVTEEGPQWKQRGFIRSAMQE